MKQEETKYLLKGKLKSGKEYEQAQEEIKLLRKSQVDFKIIKKDVKQLEKEIERKDKLISKLQKSHFTNILPRTEQIKEDIKNSDNGIATIKELNRILALIESEKRIGLSDLSKTCCMKTKRVKECINFLMRNNIVKQSTGERNSLVIERIWKEEINKMEDYTLGIFVGIFAGLFFVLFIGSMYVGEYYSNQDKRLVLDKEIANDVCQQLTNDSTAIALVEDRKLVCEIPSFDATQNIIVRQNNEGWLMAISYSKSKCILCKEESANETAPFCKVCLKKPLNTRLRALANERLKYGNKVKNAIK